MLNLINKETRQIPAGRAILRSGQSPFRRASSPRSSLCYSAVATAAPAVSAASTVSATTSPNCSSVLPGFLQGGRHRSTYVHPLARPGMRVSVGNFTVSCISEPPSPPPATLPRPSSRPPPLLSLAAPNSWPPPLHLDGRPTACPPVMAIPSSLEIHPRRHPRRPRRPLPPPHTHSQPRSPRLKAQS
jgi:hypothetical protein